MEKQSDVALGCEEGTGATVALIHKYAQVKYAWERLERETFENTRSQNQKVKPKGCWNMKKAISFELSPHAHGFTLMPRTGKKPWQRKYVKRCCTLKNIQLKKGVATQIGW